MLTQNEINALSLSPTKKDFVQIWNELLEVAGKLSERWDPTSTNESDPGIVILKALAGLADKLNYNIDKNTLEAFMPTAAQEDSMRKLCEMLGYNIKYYQSAQTDITIRYHNSNPSTEEKSIMDIGLEIPKFTTITNSDQDIKYFTINQSPIYISSTTPNISSIPCMEGQIVKCESINDNDVITAAQISENNRFYLPEVQIAENGIFIYNIYNRGTVDSSVLEDGEPWEKVDNLNVQVRGSRVFKFGFDSYEGRPYLEFPEDYSALFNDGIFIYYARTNGVNGNISPNTLTQLEAPSGWSNISLESFNVTNVFSATTGANIETIKQAYNNFKKTIGTFETLVTCRDYMNKIYLMTNENNRPLVSNILVTDIRNDINRAVVICSCDDAGIFYKETPKITGTRTLEDKKVTGISVELNKETSAPIQDGEPEPGEYKLGELSQGKRSVVRDEVLSKSELTNETEKEEQGRPVVTETFTASTANKPFYLDDGGSHIKEQITSTNADTGAITSSWVDRYTCWYVGTEVNKVALYSDQYGSSIVSEEDCSTFDNLMDGEVSAYDSEGNESDVWLITQFGKTFKTILPIEWIKSTDTETTNTKIIERELTKTREVEYERVDTQYQERDVIVKYNTTTTVNNLRVDTEVVEEAREIDHFDIVLYPFKSYNQIKSNVSSIRDVYDSSFKYDLHALTDFNGIIDRIEADNLKTISHKLVGPKEGNIVSINNYLKLNATIATNSKITAEEGVILIDKIKVALANAFNMRELDFGEEIPFDSIIEVIEKADPRIRIASLNNPALYTTFSVFVDKDANGNPILREYAVASDFLTLSEAEASKRFEYEGSSGEKISTFNTKEAKQIYNYLAVRNVLAGRVPLFNYDTTFNTSFSESSYQVTEQITEAGELIRVQNLVPKPTKDNPFTIWTEDGIIYTAQYKDNTDDSNNSGNNSSGDTTSDSNSEASSEIIYTKTYTPDKYKDNVIDKVEDNLITNISTDLIINTDKNDSTPGKISNVTLSDGEFVKFRAPNLVTTKTYPAYVNYHLKLNEALSVKPSYAEATTLFDALNADINAWDPANKNNQIGWEKLLRHFEDADNKEVPGTRKEPYRKTFTLTKKVSAFSQARATDSDICNDEDNTSGYHIDDGTGKCVYCQTEMFEKVLEGPIIINTNNKSANQEQTPEKYLASSGCVKITNDVVFDSTENVYVVKPVLKWTPDESKGEVAPDGFGPDLPLFLSNPYITNVSELTEIESSINGYLNSLRGNTTESGEPVLPTNCSWTIYIDFECVPLSTDSLAEWKRFITSDTGKNILGFSPIAENNNILWRAYGQGYAEGKYVILDENTSNTSKLLSFESNYFTTLANYTSPLHGIYVVKNLGKDSKPATIGNEADYELKPGECLYIEYTPASTTENGVAKDQAPVTEVLEAGSIIRPSGFEGGLMASSTFASLGNTHYKEVTFSRAGGTSEKVNMYRFGANEQVELRDFSQVSLSKDSFRNSPTVFIYKNFNNCPELEQEKYNKGERVNNSYTLKEGEYIFYTDENKLELAWFAAGTRVTLTGKTVIPKFDIIDLATIFDSGIKEIPWKPIIFSDDDKINFQEFQYITLGPKDTIKNMTLTSGADRLNGDWQFCSDAEYVLAGTENTQTIPELQISDSSIEAVAGQSNKRPGNGWEVSSILELGVSSNNAQTLRSTDQIESKVTVSSVSAGGNTAESGKLVIEPDNNYPVSFKTNLACQTNSGKISINEVLSNPDNLKGFELKIFANDIPTIVRTEPNKVVPYRKDNVTDITKWHGTQVKAKDASELWSYVDLTSLKLDQEDTAKYDKALRLPISVLPNTYGVFCIYINYTAKEERKTWIELLPGADNSDVSIINATDEENAWETVEDANISDRLYLRPGINCLRVNKSGKIFIKTSKNSQGILYFDDLKLVKCEPVEYKVGDTTGYMPTYGLNFEQLGYLNTNESLTKEAASKLKQNCIDGYYTEVINLEQETDKDFSESYNKLANLKAKLQSIVDFTDTAQKELDSLINTNAERVGKIFNRYQSVHSELSLKKSLLNALDNNKYTEQLEQQLIALLESFDSISTEQQQLLAELNDLEQITLEKAKNLTEDELQGCFTELYADLNDTNKAALQDAYKKVTVNKFNEQLSILATELERITNSADYEKMLSLIASLRASAESEPRARLVNAVSLLQARIDNSEINTLLETAQAAVEANDTNAVLSALYQLENLFLNDNLADVVAELEVVISLNNFSKENKENIEGILARLNSLVDDDTLNTNTKREIIKAISKTISDFEASNSKDPQSAIKTLKNKIAGEYAKDIQSLTESITTILKSLTIDVLLADIESYINTTKNTQIAEIKVKLETLINDTISSSYMTILPDSLNNYLARPFGKEAANLAVATHLAQISFESISLMCNKLEASILNKELNISDRANTIPANLNTFKDVLNLDIFLDLFDKVSHFCAKATQINASNAYIEGLAKELFILPEDITSAMRSITDGKNNRNLVIISTINKINNTDSIKTRKSLVDRLRVELAAAIAEDTQIFNTVAKLLCPSISLFNESVLAEYNKDNEFYKKFITRVNDFKKSLLQSADHEATLKGIKASLSTISTNEAKLLEHVKADKTDGLISWLDSLVINKFKEDSILPDNFITVIALMKQLVNVKNEITKTKKADFFESTFVSKDITHSEAITNWSTTAKLTDQSLIDLLARLSERLRAIEADDPESFEKAYIIFETERQLLADIKALDVNNDFYYSATVNPSLAIELNKSDALSNTLMNPATNYDINNINNCFVISKLDIDYLDKGIQIARSSRLN